MLSKATGYRCVQIYVLPLFFVDASIFHVITSPSSPAIVARAVTSKTCHEEARELLLLMTHTLVPTSCTDIVSALQ